MRAWLATQRSWLVVERLPAYAPDLNPVGAATVSARSIMNLYVVLRSLGADGIAPGAIQDELRKAKDDSSFMGHAYTCDGEQLADLTATCAPQQILITMDDGELSQIGDWIDVRAAYPG